MANESLTTISASVSMKATLNLVSGDHTAQYPGSMSWTPATFTDGTTANKANRWWESTARALAQSATEDIDVFDLGSIDIGAGAGLTSLGQAWATVEIAGFAVENDTTSTGSLLIGGKGATTAWNAWINANDDAEVGPLTPGGVFMFFNPTDPAIAVADTTNHLLTMTESGVGALTYNIYILARSA